MFQEAVEVVEEEADREKSVPAMAEAAMAEAAMVEATGVTVETAAMMEIAMKAVEEAVIAIRVAIVMKTVGEALTDLVVIVIRPR